MLRQAWLRNAYYIERVIILYYFRVYLTHLTLRERGIIILFISLRKAYRANNRHIPVLFLDGVSCSF